MAAGSGEGEFIAAVNLDRLDPGEMDQASRRLMEQEQVYLSAWRKYRGDAEQGGAPRHPVGLALSGGGIRSASFSLGILQVFADRGLLKRIDYLSTVSGGGYIGSAISWLTSARAAKEAAEAGGGEALETRFGLDRDDFPFGTDSPDPAAEQSATSTQQRMLKYLREHGYYLSPGAGINLVSLVAVVLRGVVLNLLVWLPVLVLFFLFGLWGSAWLWEHGVNSMPLLSRLLHADIGLREHPGLETRLPELLGFEWFLWIGAGILVLLILGAFVYSVLTWFRRGATKTARKFWYEMRRRSESLSAFLLPAMVVTLLIGSLPLVGALLEGWLATAGPLALVTGIVVTLRHFLKSCTSDSPLPLGLSVSVGAVLFLYGIVLVSFQIAVLAYPAIPDRGFVLAALILVPAVTGWLVNLNYISIHRYYRDRLMETFMPDIPDALKNETGDASGADGATLQAVGDTADPRAPYHIVNTNLVLVNSDNTTWKKRGGDNFILAPLYCGSNATGWCQTTQFMGGKMTLATAVAISGAAFNPNAGVGGAGVTRNPFLSAVMSLLNLRLGYWACHPDQKKRPLHGPNHFRPGAYAFGSAFGLPRHGFHEGRPFLQLTDGGHFENTGVYELVRRRLKLIIVCDGGADPEFSFSDFQTTVRRIEDDFGARVKVLDDATPDRIVPVRGSGEEGVYPKGAAFAEHGYMVGRITYADGSTGNLIYLKTTLFSGVSFKVKGYAAQDPDFPDQSTADQFFDEVQFEAYRELGYSSAEDMLGAPVPADVDVGGAPGPATLDELIRNC
jgi:hypothetical protein